MSFASTLKDLRLKKRLTLRDCSFQLGVDPSNWSKLERAINPAPKDESVLRKWADFFDLTNEQQQEFLDLGSLSRKEIPSDIASDEAVIAALPVFFRAVRGKELEGAQLDAFMKDLREVQTPDRE